MAQLQFMNGTTTTDIDRIGQTLAPLHVRLSQWPIQNQVEQLLQKSQLSDTEKETVASAHDLYFEQLKEESGYQSRDLIVLHPNIPNLDALLEKFSRIHTHDDDDTDDDDVNDVTEDSERSYIVE